MNLLLNVSNVKRRFRQGDAWAVAGVSLQVEQGELLGLVGESGCGKSTLLRMIAGLEVADEGELSLADELVTQGQCLRVPAEKRGLGMVFQDHALFPHLSVGRNISYGMRGKRRRVRQQRVKELLDRVRLPQDFASRRPHELSGGERQRVALARALAPHPRMLLLDEPFSHLDARNRRVLREELPQILRAEGVGGLIVTHDSQDALSMVDRLAVMRAGRLLQVGSPHEVYFAPASHYVATMFGYCNVLPPGCSQQLGSAEMRCHVGIGDADEDSKAGLWVRPEALRLVPLEETQRGLKGVVERMEFCGEHLAVDLVVEAEEEKFVVRVEHRNQALRPKLGQAYRIVPGREAG